MVGICHRLLKRLDYTIDQDDRPGAIVKTSRTGLPGNQVQHYQIVDHPSAVYQQLLVASRARHELFAAISKGETVSSRDDCKPDETPTAQAFDGEGSQLIPFASGADKEEAEDFEEDYLADVGDEGFD